MDNIPKLPAPIAESDAKAPATPAPAVPQPEDAARESHSGRPAPSVAGSGSVSPKQLNIIVEDTEDSARKGDEEKPPITNGGLRPKWRRRLSSISLRGNAAGQEPVSKTNQGEDTERAGGRRLGKKQHPEQATEDTGGEER